MMQDPKKDIQKPSVKEKLARYSANKKVGVGEMGKPDLKAGFEAAMQKERDFVLNRAKKREEDVRERLTRFVKDVKEVKAPLKDDIGKTITESWKEVRVPVKKKSSKLSAMMSKKSM